MPIVKVYGLPNTFQGDPCLKDLKSSIANAIARKVPKLKASQVSVFFPVDLDCSVDGTEICAFVDGLFSRPERTAGVRKDVAEAVCAMIYCFVMEKIKRRPKLVECLVRPFNAEDGFAEL
jgi:hypothetical protein